MVKSLSEPHERESGRHSGRQTEAYFTSLYPALWMVRRWTGLDGSDSSFLRMERMELSIVLVVGMFSSTPYSHTSVNSMSRVITSPSCTARYFRILNSFVDSLISCFFFLASCFLKSSSTSPNEYSSIVFREFPFRRINVWIRARRTFRLNGFVT